MYLARHIKPEVRGHVGVEIPEAVERAKGEVEHEAPTDGQHSRAGPILHLHSYTIAARAVKSEPQKHQ